MLDRGVLAVAVGMAASGFALAGPGAALGHPRDAHPSSRGAYPPDNDVTTFPAFDAGQPLETAPVQRNREPPLRPVPRARCGRASEPLEGMQGRVPASALEGPQAAAGWTCNLGIVGHHPGPGGWKVWRYVDERGHECAFYDTSMAYPLNVIRAAAGPSPGVAVLDMSDPAHPIRTATLTAPPMLSPHESLNLNPRRGLLVAEMGNGATLPALMSIYDVSRDCRQPTLRSTTLPTRFGHESGFSRDGRTFWIGGGVGISAVDVSDPVNPRTLWSGNAYAHGLSVSRDGNRLYDSDPINGQLAILDVSEVQARDPDPSVREISRLTWNSVTIPQNSAPMRIEGKPYLLEWDEFAFRLGGVAPLHTVGAARIIDISDETRPQVVSNLRLRINQPDAHAAAGNDPSPPLPWPFFGYTAHYCAIPRANDPTIVACSFMNSGLRIFNIENPRRPREVAYFVAPRAAPPGQGAAASNFAVSKPAFDPARRQVWYSDGNSGFYALELTKRAWPGAG